MHRPQPSARQAALFLVTGRVVSSLLAFVTAALLARRWSEQQYGEYRQLWLAFQALGPMAALGVPAGLTFFLPQIDRGRQKTAVAQAFLILSVTGGLIGLATIGWSLLLSPAASGEGLSAAAAFSLYPVFALPLLVTDAWLLAIRRSQAAAWFTVNTALIQSVATAVPVVMGCGVAEAMGWLTLATFARFLIVFGFYRSEYNGVDGVWDLGFPRRMLGYAVPLGLASVVGGMNLLLDKLVIAHWCTPSEFATYCIGAVELPAVGIISTSVAMVLAPEFVRLYHDSNRRREMLAIWHASIHTTAMLMFPLTAGILLFAPDVVTLLYSEKYLPSVPVFRVYLLILPLRITVYGSLLLAAGRSRTVLAASLAGLLLAAGLLGVLVPAFGMPGAAASTVLSVYGTSAILLFQSAKLLGVSYGHVFPWRDLLLSLVASVAGMAAAAVLTQHFSPGVIRLIVGLIATYGICAAFHLVSARHRANLIAVARGFARRRSGGPSTVHRANESDGCDRLDALPGRESPIDGPHRPREDVAARDAA